MLLNNLYIFGKRQTKNPTCSVESQQKEFYNAMAETNNLLDHTDARFSKARVSHDLFNNSLTRRKITEAYFQGLEHNKRPRLVKKCGELNIHMDNVPKHKRRLLSDMFNTILDMKWRWHLVIFFLSFIVSWFVFATIWYLIAYFHGDLDTGNEANQTLYKNNTNELVKASYLNNAMQLIDQVSDSILTNEKIPSLNQTLGDIVRKQAGKIKERQPCVNGIHDFTSALLYSVETQHTIGYGLRYITEECKFAIIFLMLQSCFGIFVQGLVAGVVFAKISRPNKRKRTIIFSHNAVVSERDGKLCFMFKIGNVRTSQLSDARLRVSMIKSRKTKEGEFIPFQSYDMKVGFDWSGDSVFFPWPKTVEHIIDENSPLYDFCRDYLGDSKSDDSSSSDDRGQEIKTEDYEIMVILEGNIETTGASCHIRTSYLPQEILFGYRFVPVYPKFTDFEYLFDYSKFNQIEPINCDLINLNKSYFNKESRVYDARKEQKNYQLTMQNTNQAGDKTGKEPASLMAILSSFKANSGGENTISTVIDEVESEKKENKNGRFTVVPVQESKTKACFDKNKNCTKHSRTSSLPPIKSSPMINQIK